MPRPTGKDELQTNELNWFDYQKTRMFIKDEHGNDTEIRDIEPILMPIIVGINEDGEITRERMETPHVKKIAKKLKAELPKYMFDRKLTKYDPEKIFEDYIKFFDEQDTSQGFRPPNPLDIKVSRPVWVLFYMKPDSWTFSEGTQYSTENDPDDMRRNFEKIATMADENALLLSNRRRSAPDDLKFNLHVTITQKIGGKVMKTPIIIDPDQDNNSGGGGWGGWQ